MADYGSLPFEEAIAYLRKKVDVPTARWDDITGQAHDHAFVVAGATKANLLGDLHAAVLAAVEEGISLGEFTARFEATVAKHGWTGWTGEDTTEGRAWRARVIYSTNLRTSYSAGRLSQQRAIAEHRPYWRYRHNDTVSHPRPIHKSWNGTTLPADDPWFRTHYTPCGFGCRCYIESLAAEDLGPAGISPVPDNGTYEVIDRRTGEVHTLPAGVDYGWDHMPGDTRALVDEVRAGAARLPAGLRGALERDLSTIPGAQAAPTQTTTHPLPVYTPASTPAEAKRVAQAIIDARGPVEYPTGPDGRPVVRFRHIGTRDVAADRLGRVNPYTLPVELGNLVNQTLVEMAAEADRLGIPRLRGLTSAVSKAAAAEMGDGVLGISKGNSAALAPGGAASLRAWAVDSRDAAARAIALGERYANAEHVAVWTARRDKYDAIIARLDAGEAEDVVMASETSQWRLGGDPKQRPGNVREYFWRGADQTRKTLWHEFGHHIHQTLGATDADSYKNPSLERRLDGLFRTVTDGPSGYSRSNPREWFAECFACWKMGRRDLVPAPVADLIASLYKGGT